MYLFFLNAESFLLGLKLEYVKLVLKSEQILKH